MRDPFGLADVFDQPLWLDAIMQAIHPIIPSGWIAIPSRFSCFGQSVIF